MNLNLSDPSADPVATPRSMSAVPSMPPPLMAGGVTRLLVVDDDDGIRSVFARCLRGCGYQVETAGSTEEALEWLRRTRFSLLLCEVRLPGASGLELMSTAHAIDPDVATIMISAADDARTAAAAMRGGALDYLVKPVSLPGVLESVERTLHQRDLTVDRRRCEQLIREEVAAATDELARERAALRTMTVSAAGMVINAMEAKDVYLRGHSQRVSSLGAEIAEELGLDADTVEDTRLAGRLHDVGKIGIRESVLNKPGKLTIEEFEHVKDHVRIGVEILTPFRDLGNVLSYVHDHHEHWDGGGYPRGRTGTDISIGGRVLAAADAFDAITSPRAYRAPRDRDATIEHLGALRGILLDPDVFDALRDVTRRGQSMSLHFIDDLRA